MKEELEKLVAAGKITHRHIEPLLALVQGGFGVHKSWGFGRIRTVDVVLGRLSIDFHSKAGHAMDLSFAAESLKPVDKNHILARKATDLAGLKQQAALHHLDVVRLVLRSFNNRATIDQIQAALVPDVIGEDWKKWWEAARTEMKKDGHFNIPAKKTEPILLQETEVSLQTRLSSEFRAAKGLKARIAVALEVAKCMGDLQDKQSVITEVLSVLNADIQSHLTTMPSLALEGVFARDDVRAAAGLAPDPADPTEAAVWTHSQRLHTFFDETSAPRQRRALESFKNHVTEWGPQLVGILNSSGARLCGETARLLMQEGKTQLLYDTLARLIGQHGASSELLLWFGKERSEAFVELFTPEVFRAMLTAMERDAFNEKKSNRLHDFILSDQQLLPELIESTDFDVIKDLTRNLQLSPAFDDMDKRSLLGRIVKQYPAIQSMITGDQKRDKEDHTFVVSWPSLERRKAEYEELVQKRVPANVKDIALARSYGDLRENAEYKAAKETQKVLSRRKHELEVELNRARGTEFDNPRLDVVSPGTIIRVFDLGLNKTETYTILGAWDGDPDKNILSYLTPLAKAFVGQPVGKEVEFSEIGEKRRFRIEHIEAFKKN